MTPAQQVALDAMRSAWPEDVVARMLEVESPDLLPNLCEAAYALGAADARRMRSMSVEERMAHARGRVRLVLGPTLSPPETPIGASPHRPQGETLICADCHVHPCRCEHFSQADEQSQ